MQTQPSLDRRAVERRPVPPISAPHVIERKRQVRGLLLLAAAALGFAIWRAGGAHAFNPGWWRLW